MWRYALVGVLLGGWGLLGDPKNDVANLFWPDTPAPWETVDAVYYPNRSDLSFYEREAGFENLDECRDWAVGLALQNSDDGMRVGDYECGFGFLRDWGDLKVYRNTTR